MTKRVRAHVNPLSITKEISFSGFPNDNTIIVDVGSCKGEFAEELIKKFPEKNYILFEIRVPLMKKLEEKFKDYSNVVVFGGDGGRNFESILKPSVDRGIKIETIYVNFPDPWFKDRHKKRRFITPKFLEKINDFINCKTTFIFQTDQKFLFDETLEILRNSSFNDIEFFDSSPFGIRTDWEETTMKLGRKIWRVRFKRQNTKEQTPVIRYRNEAKKRKEKE